MAPQGTGETVVLGCVGDAFRLRSSDCRTDVFHRRPTTDAGLRTTVGVCWNYPLLVLFGDRGRIDWPARLGVESLPTGRLLSGDTVHVIRLEQSEWQPLLLQTDGAELPLATIREWAARSRAAR